MNLLLISFDLQKAGHPIRTLAMGNIISSWKREIPNNAINHESIDIKSPSFDVTMEMKRIQLKWDFTTLHIIAFQVAVWSEEYVKKAYENKIRLDFPFSSDPGIMMLPVPI